MRYLISHLREVDQSSNLDHIQVDLGANLQNSALKMVDVSTVFKRLLKTDPLIATKSMIGLPQSTLQEGVGSEILPCQWLTRLLSSSALSNSQTSLPEGTVALDLHLRTTLLVASNQGLKC